MPHQHQQQSSGNGDARGHVQPHQQRDATPKPIGSDHPPRSVSHAQCAVFHSCAEGMLSQPNRVIVTSVIFIETYLQPMSGSGVVRPSRRPLGGLLWHRGRFRIPKLKAQGIKVIAPEGLIVNARDPAPVACWW